MDNCVKSKANVKENTFSCSLTKSKICKGDQIRKKAFVILFEAVPQLCLEGLSKIAKSTGIVSDVFEIRMGYFHNASPEAIPR